MFSSQLFTKVLQEWVEVFMHRSFRDFKRFMDESGLSASQVNTLMRLYHRGACGVTDIAQSLGITIAATSQLVDKLVLNGLIDRTEDESDRRARQITLTKQGYLLIQESMTAWSGWMEDLTTTLSKEELQAITEALKLLTEAALRLDNGLGVSRNLSKSKEAIFMREEHGSLD
jgi:DNA-binding MarR family transcriptional regulator